MKKILSIIVAIMFIVSCASPYYMTHTLNGYYSDKQVDSICRAERIPKIDKPDTWVKFQMLDGESNNLITQYTYIKFDKYKDSVNEITYVCLDMDTINKFTKRVLTEKK